MHIKGTFISSIDYPGGISLVIPTTGCDLRCSYCHNPELIHYSKEINPIQEIYKKINDIEDFIDCITITGGEPTLQIKTVEKILKYAKKKGLKTKLDTNGYYPERIKKILKKIDYVGLDVKAPENKYKKITGLNIWKEVNETIQLIQNTPNVFLECRTTYVPILLTPNDIIIIAKNINCDLYTIQQFRNKTVLDLELKNIENPNPYELREIGKKIKTYQKNVKIKTAEFGEELI